MEHSQRTTFFQRKFLRNLSRRRVNSATHDVSDYQLDHNVSPIHRLFSAEAMAMLIFLCLTKKTIQFIWITAFIFISLRTYIFLKN